MDAADGLAETGACFPAGSLYSDKRALLSQRSPEYPRAWVAAEDRAGCVGNARALQPESCRAGRSEVETSGSERDASPICGQICPLWPAGGGPSAEMTPDTGPSRNLPTVVNGPARGRGVDFWVDGRTCGPIIRRTFVSAQGKPVSGQCGSDVHHGAGRRV